MKKDEPESTKYLTDDDCFWAWYSLWLKKVSEEEPWLVSGGKTKIKWKKQRYTWERKKPKRIQLCLPHLLIYLFFFFLFFWVPKNCLNLLQLQLSFWNKMTAHTLSLVSLSISVDLRSCVFLFWNKITFCVSKTVKGVKKQLLKKNCTFFFYHSYCNSSLIVSHVLVLQREKNNVIIILYIWW